MQQQRTVRVHGRGGHVAHAGRQAVVGEFRGLSLPAMDFEQVSRFWQALGLAASEEEARLYPHLSLGSEDFALSLHEPRFFAEPLLVFGDVEMATRIAHLRELGVGALKPPPRGLDMSRNALLEAPEGTALLLCNASPPP